MEPEIEILKPEQWQEYREIRLKALQTDPTAFGESYEREIKRPSEEIIRKLSDSNLKVYVARVDNKIVALAYYTLVLPGHVDHNAKIHAVFVTPEYRGQGIGFKLIKQILNDLHQIPKISRLWLSVGNEQVAAKNMYKKLGFKECGIGTKEMKIDGKYYDEVQMELIFEDKLS